VSWQARYHWRRFVLSSLWVPPVASMVLALIVAPVVRRVDERTQWTLLGFGLDGAKALTGALSSTLLTLIVFAFSILLLAVQVAGGQLSPRVIARVFEGRLSKSTLSTFVFSYTFSLAALGRVEGRVPQLPVMLVVVASLLGIGLFIGLIQAAAHNLRPVAVLTGVAGDTRAAIEAVYPRPFEPASGRNVGVEFDSTRAERSIEHRGRSGVLLAFNTGGLTDIANQAGCVVELVPQVGDFLATGGEVFRLHGGGATAVDEGSLHRCVALGSEGALENNPAFGLRVIVEIAGKALSPAINDPATGVLAIDQLEHLLHLLSQRQLDSGVVRDASGTVRLVYRSPRWEDFVALAVTEIRLYGATSPETSRRLCAMLEHLLEVVPAERARPIEEEMALLVSTIERSFADPADRRRAAVADRQGFGSPARRACRSPRA